MEKIDKKDRILLYELRRDCRQPYSRLAKAAGISKQMVHYRIARLVRLGVLETPSLAIDAGRLGYQNYGIYVQLEDYSRKDALVGELVKDQVSRYIAEGSGKADLIISLFAKTPLEFQQNWDHYLSRYGAAIRSHAICVSTENLSFARSFLSGGTERTRKAVFLGSAGEPVSIDAHDIAILKALAHNSRASIVSVAKSCGITPETVKSRMRRMEKAGLIQGYGWLYNPGPLGLGFYELLLSLRNMDSAKWGELREYCRSNPKISYFIRSIGAFDADLVFEVASDDEFHDGLRDLRSLFSSHIHDFEIVKVVREHKFSYAPFL